MRHTRTISTGIAWLLAGAMLVVVLGPSQFQVQVDAAMTASRDGFTLLTARSRDQRVSSDSEAVYCIDHRRGMLLVYGLVAPSSPDARIVMLDGGHISTLFERARAVAPSQTAP